MFVSFFAPLMFAGLHTYSPQLTMSPLFCFWNVIWWSNFSNYSGRKNICPHYIKLIFCYVLMFLTRGCVGFRTVIPAMCTLYARDFDTLIKFLSYLTKLPSRMQSNLLSASFTQQMWELLAGNRTAVPPIVKKMVGGFSLWINHYFLFHIYHDYDQCNILFVLHQFMPIHQIKSW